MSHRTKRQTACFLSLALLLVFLLLLNINSGSIRLNPGEILHVLTSRETADTQGQIIWEIRLP